MRKVLALIVFVVLTTLVAAFPYSVSAQVATDNILREQYKKQLETYRNDERQFVIAKEQYVKLKTLASLEEAVRSTQKVMRSRVDVLETYITLVRNLLQRTNGIEVKLKEEQLTALTTILEEVKKHRTAVDVSVDRAKIAQTSQEYAVLSPKITTSVFRSLSLVAYGNIQAVYDKTFAISLEAEKYVEEQEKNALKLAEKKRSFVEIKKILEQTKSQLEERRAAFAPSENNREQSSDSQGYQRTVEELGPVFANLSRTISYLNEVMQ